MSREASAVAMTHSSVNVVPDEDQAKNLIFTLKGELYGTSLMQVKEVIKMGNIKPVPYMKSCFLGVTNLRGQIVGIMDLGIRLGLRQEANQSGLVIVTETVFGILGVVIDDLLSVEHFEASEVDRKVPVESRIAPDFFCGIAKYEDRLVHLIDLAKLVSEDDFRAIHSR